MRWNDCWGVLLHCRVSRPKSSSGVLSRDHPQPYDIGEEEFHLAFKTDDYAAAHTLHQEMGCICFENEAMGIYFIQDPDGYWLEIVPDR